MNIIDKKIGVVSLGCDKNRVDTEYMMTLLKKAGYGFTADYKDADLVIVNTCAFILPARKEAIEAIFEASAKKKDGAKLIVAGCLPQKYSVELAVDLPEVDRFLRIAEYDKIVEIAGKLLRIKADAPEIAGRGEKGERQDPVCGYSHYDRVLTTPSHYAYLKIADGCDNRCTYCTIPSIRGKYRSREIDDIVSEARALAERGAGEILLVAQDVTNYGADLYGEPALVGLLRALKQVAGVKYRLLYCYPERIDGALIEEIRTNDSIIKYIDVPLQHCNSRILRLMGRRSDKGNIKRLLSLLRAAVPGIAIRTTFIIGFPSETVDEFSELLDFLREQRFFNAGFFAYSPEEDTPSFRIKGRIPAEEVDKRIAAAAAVQREVVLANNARLLGTLQKVVIDSLSEIPRIGRTGDERGFYAAVGRAYCHAPEIDGVVRVKSRKPLTVGAIYDVSISKVKGYDLTGEALLPEN